MSTAPTFAHDELDRLGEQLAVSGVAAATLGIRRLVASARATGIPSVAVDVLADSDAPDVVRLRAFAKVAALVARHAEPASTPRPQVA